MLKKSRFPLYNHGMVSIYREIDKRNNFSAKINPISIRDLYFVAKLAFSETSKRQQDLEYAEQQGFTLTLKIKTRFVKGVDNKCKAIIDGYLYDVSYVDATRTELFLYLQGVDYVTNY